MIYWILLCLSVSSPQDSLFLEAQNYLFKASGEDLAQADSIFKKLIKTYPDGQYANDALYYLELLTRYREESEFKNYLSLEKLLNTGEYVEILKITENLSKGPLIPYFLMVRGEAMVGIKKWEEAINLLKGLAKEYPTSIGARALFKAFLIARTHLPKLKDELLKELILKFPYSPYAEVARVYQ